MDQMAAIANNKSDQKPRTPNIRMPSFDIDKDAKTFPQWLSRWISHVKTNKLHNIDYEAERMEVQMGHLKAALTDNTLRWLDFKEIEEEDKSDPDKVIAAIKAHIKIC